MLAVEFVVRDIHVAIDLASVVEIAPRVAVTPLPGSPPVVEGICRCRGELVVVVDVRARFGFSAPRSIDDHFVVVRTPMRTLALVADRVVGLREVDPAAVHPSTLRLPHIEGVSQLEDGVLLLFDVDASLALDEEQSVDDALARIEAPP